MSADLLEALVTYLRASPAIAAVFPGDTEDPVSVFTGMAKAAATPPFLIVDLYSENDHGETLQDQRATVSIVVVTSNGLDTARSHGKTVKAAIDTPNIDPSLPPRSPLIWTGGRETFVLRNQSTPRKQNGIGKGGKYIYAEQIDYEFWTEPQ